MFSDGTYVKTGSLPDNANPEIIQLPGQGTLVDWIKLRIDDAKGSNTGLLEIDVFGNPVN